MELAGAADIRRICGAYIDAIYAAYIRDMFGVRWKYAIYTPYPEYIHATDTNSESDPAPVWFCHVYRPVWICVNGTVGC